MKKAFSFIEVIISAVILSFMGVAILNFNSFNKRAMEDNINKQNTLLLSSAFLYMDKDVDTDKSYKLYDLVAFNNLSDDDNKFLKNIELKGKQNLNEKIFLYTDGKDDFYIDYGSTLINYKDYKPLPFIYLKRPQ